MTLKITTKKIILKVNWTKLPGGSSLRSRNLMTWKAIIKEKKLRGKWRKSH